MPTCSSIAPVHDRKTLVLSERDVSAIVTSVGVDTIMEDCIATLEASFLEFGDGATSLQPRVGFVYDQPEPGLVEFMISMRGQKCVCLKSVGYHPGNPTQRDLPTIIATNTLYDVRTGHLLALVDGTFATAVRTGAASAVASKLFARLDSRVLGVIGCGAQAVTQAHALSRSFEFDSVLLYDTNTDHVASFPERCSSFLATQMKEVSKEEVIAQSDILVVATSNDVGAPPVVPLQRYKPHLHINAVGSDIPGKVEISIDVLRRALVIPDYLDQCLVEGECQQMKKDDIAPELHLMIKQKDQFEHSRDQLTVYDSTGNPLEDLVVTEILVRHAKALGLGLLINVESGLYDSLNPYKFSR